MPDKKEEIVKESRLLEGICSEASFRHDRMRDFWNVMHYTMGISLVILFVLVTFLLIGGVKVFPVVLSVLGSILSGAFFLVNPYRKALDNDRSGKDYLTLKGRISLFRRIQCETDDANTLYSNLESIRGEKDVLFHDAPPTFDFKIRKEEEKGS